MTYQEIVNRIQDITNQHKMLADFGYGDISDLKIRFENTSGDAAVQADYPYLFLNPGVHGRTQGMVTYNFNMIVMDMARGEVSDQPYNNMLAIQSQCQQYIDDVIAYLHNAFKDLPDVNYSGVTYTPFNERFQDEVSGMTATLTIEVPQPINNCITPILPKENLLLYTFTNPNVNGTNDFHSAFIGLNVKDPINYPEYDWQWNTFEAYFSTFGEFDYNSRYAPLVINDDPDTTGEGLVPYFDRGSREVIIPAGYNNPIRLDWDLELTNVQGLDLTGDQLRIQIIINGQDSVYLPIPNLPVDGTPVVFIKSFEYTPTPGLVDDIRILFRYSDGGTPAPDGPIVGYRGDFKIQELGE